jgi:peptidoglycan/xylan/chitin deacetylase (PgdA/CDA1 family)
VTGISTDGVTDLQMTLSGYLKAKMQEVALRTGISARKALSQRCVRFLMFHEVGCAGFPLEVFEEQLDYLHRHFEVLPVGQAVSRLRDQRIVGDEVILTFDDGLQSHATSVYPILEKLQTYATFFICPGLIEANEGIWTLETRALLASLPAPRGKVWHREVGAPEGGDDDRIIAWMKGLPVAVRRDVFARLCDVVVPSARERRRPPLQPLMSWDQLRRLDPGIVTIGSHSLSHPTLTLLEDAELERELEASQKLLRERLGRDAQIFCYPDGAYDERVVQATRRHYEAALTTAEDVSRPGGDPYVLPRIPAGASLPLFAWRLHRPAA